MLRMPQWEMCKVETEIKTMGHAEAGSVVLAGGPEQPAADKLDTGLALRYSVANLGASVVYGLFNFALPPYLATYHLHPSLIGLLANERSLVGAFVQPFIGRLSDRTRSPLGRRRPFLLVGVPPGPREASRRTAYHGEQSA